MKKLNLIVAIGLHLIFTVWVSAQEVDSKELTIDRLFNSREFSQDYLGPVTWFEDGESYVKLEPAQENSMVREVCR